MEYTLKDWLRMNIILNLSIKLSNNKKEYVEKLMVERGIKLFYIRNNNI